MDDLGLAAEELVQSVSADSQLLSRPPPRLCAAVRGSLWVPFPSMPLSPGPRLAAAASPDHNRRDRARGFQREPVSPCPSTTLD